MKRCLKWVGVVTLVIALMAVGVRTYILRTELPSLLERAQFVADVYPVSAPNSWTQTQWNWLDKDHIILVKRGFNLIQDDPKITRVDVVNVITRHRVTSQSLTRELLRTRKVVSGPHGQYIPALEFSDGKAYVMIFPSGSSNRESDFEIVFMSVGLEDTGYLCSPNGDTWRVNLHPDTALPVWSQRLGKWFRVSKPADDAKASAKRFQDEMIKNSNVTTAMDWDKGPWNWNIEIRNSNQSVRTVLLKSLPKARQPLGTDAEGNLAFTGGGPYFGGTSEVDLTFVNLLNPDLPLKPYSIKVPNGRVANDWSISPDGKSLGWMLLQARGKQLPPSLPERMLRFLRINKQISLPVIEYWISDMKGNHWKPVCAIDKFAPTMLGISGHGTDGFQWSPDSRNFAIAYGSKLYLVPVGE